MNVYTLYWIYGKAETVRGETVEQAMTAAGYGKNALQAVRFYHQGQERDWQWDDEKREWFEIMEGGRERRRPLVALVLRAGRACAD